MNDEFLISLYLDGRLEPGAIREFEARLEREPALRAEFDAARRLQMLAQDLPHARARFDADDVRVRFGERAGRPNWRHWGIAAAAVLALGLSHLAAYRAGSESRPVEPPLSERVEDVIAETEQLMQRASYVDASAPPEELSTKLVGLRDEIEMSRLPYRLTELTEQGADEPLRRRAAELVNGLALLETAFEQHRDPGFLGLVVARIGRETLEGEPEMRYVPSTASNFMRVSPIGNGRYRVVIVTASGDRPLVREIEGTPQELRERNVEIRFIGDE